LKAVQEYRADDGARDQQERDHEWQGQQQAHGGAAILGGA
jgi:hypothetical protein